MCLVEFLLVSYKESIVICEITDDLILYVERKDIKFYPEHGYVSI